MSSRRRTLTILCWLAIAALLVRIAIADTVEDVVAAPTTAGAIALLTGLGLILAGATVVVTLGLGIRVNPARRLSLAAGAVALGFGLLLLLAGHESGSLVAVGGGVAALIAVPPGADGDGPD